MQSDGQAALRPQGQTAGWRDLETLDDAHAEGSGKPLSSVHLTEDEIRAADCVVIVTNHSAIDYARVIELAPLVVDTRNALNGDLRRGSRARIIRL